MLHEADHISHKKQRQCHNIRHNVVMLSHKLIVRHVPMQHCSQECLSDNRMPLLTAPWMHLLRTPSSLRLMYKNTSLHTEKYFVNRKAVTKCLSSNGQEVQEVQSPTYEHIYMQHCMCSSTIWLPLSPVSRRSIFRLQFKL